MKNIGRYRDLAILFTRYGRKDFKLRFDANESLPVESGEVKPLEPDVQERALAFAESLKAMGPTYVKFGQVLSTRPDIVPPEYIDALEKLQDQVEPFSFAEVEKIVESELNVRISKAFETFESVPLAAASLGQVHRATLRDGREVVVKVQRPNVREMVPKDLEVFTEIATLLESHSDVARKMNLVSSVDQARRTLINELNYTQEAQNTEVFRRNLADFPEISIPSVIHDFSTGRVLTTEMVHGKKVSQLTPLALIDHDYAELAAVLTRAYLKQICVDGFWHSDPHPGNVFIRGDELVLLDFGMVSRITAEFQDEVTKLLLGVTGNRSADVADACIKLSKAQEGFDYDRFLTDVASVLNQYYSQDVRNINIGQLIFYVIGIASQNELKVPSELALFAKTLLHLDSITRKLDPDFNPQDVIRDYAENLIAQKVRQKFNPRTFYGPLLDLHQLAVDFPKQARMLLTDAAGGKTIVNLKMAQVEDILKGMHKIANRITVGLIVAALIVGSSLIMRVPTRFVLFGYPALAVSGYLFASAIGFYLVISTLTQDHRDQLKARRKG